MDLCCLVAYSWIMDNCSLNLPHNLQHGMGGLLLLSSQDGIGFFFFFKHTFCLVKKSSQLKEVKLKKSTIHQSQTHVQNFCFHRFKSKNLKYVQGSSLTQCQVTSSELMSVLCIAMKLHYMEMESKDQQLLIRQSNKKARAKSSGSKQCIIKRIQSILSLCIYLLLLKKEHHSVSGEDCIDFKYSHKLSKSKTKTTTKSVKLPFLLRVVKILNNLILFHISEFPKLQK